MAAKGNSKQADGGGAERKPAGATARTCPLVLDGELAPSDFSPDDCVTCDEFDCRFCEAEPGSGSLRSRLFAASDDAEGEDEGWGGEAEGFPEGDDSDSGGEEDDPL